MLIWYPVDNDPEVIRGFFRGYRVSTVKSKNFSYRLELWLDESYFIALCLSIDHQVNGIFACRFSSGEMMMVLNRCGKSTTLSTK